LYLYHKTTPPRRGCFMRKNLFLARQNLEHFGATLFASAGHRPSLGAALSLKRNLLGVFHNPARLVPAPDAICFYFIHIFCLIIKLIHSLPYLNLNVNPV